MPTIVEEQKLQLLILAPESTVLEIYALERLALDKSDCNR